MHVMRRCALAAGSLGLVILAAATARAAEVTPASGEIAVGYSYIYLSDSSTAMPLGWFLSGGPHLTDTLAIVGSYKSQPVANAGATISQSTRVHTFLAGPRVMHRSGQLAFYGQFLVGTATLSATSTVNVIGNLSLTTSELCLAPGAGIDIALSDTGAFRAGVSERLIRASGNRSKEFQFQLGLVYRFGR
jgi:hypothetical protein